MHSSLRRIRHWLVRLIYLAPRVFLNVFVPHSVPVAPGTYYDDLPVQDVIVGDVRVTLKYPPHGGTNLSDHFLTR